MPIISKFKLWLLGTLLFCYIIGVLLLSAISLNGLKRNSLSLKGKTIYPGNHASHQKLHTPRRNDVPIQNSFNSHLRRTKIQWCSKLKFIESGNPLIAIEKPVALVSFPGSGNTWLRYLLQQATGYFTGSVYKDYGLLKNGFPAESMLNTSVLVVKTHEWGWKARNMFSKAILLVRAPDKAILAEFNRQSGGHIGFASPDRYRRNNGKHWQEFVADNLRGWQQLNLDWLYNFTGPSHVIFYENLVNNTEHTLKSVINFLGVDVTEDKMHCAIERKEGIYRRRKMLINFDPFTTEMKSKMKEVQKIVYNAIFHMAPPEQR